MHLFHELSQPFILRLESLVTVPLSVELRHGRSTDPRLDADSAATAVDPAASANRDRAPETT
jgi:hypothetical protein